MSDVDSGEFAPLPRTALPETFDPEFGDDPTPKREREGLPSSYRMRADAHYVDQLTSTRRSQSDALRPVPLPAPVGDEGVFSAERRDRGREARLEQLLAQLSEDIATIGAAAGLLAGEASGLARRVNLDLIRTQAWRASWLLRANALLSGTHDGQIRPRPLPYLLNQVRNGFAAECRLNGLTLDVQANDWNTFVNVDEGAVIAGITGALIATQGLISQAHGDGAAIALRVTAGAGELRTVEIAQKDVSITPIIAKRFFDVTWTERAGGWLAAFGAATAQAAAQRHQGDATIERVEQSGGLLMLRFARG